MLEEVLCLYTKCQVGAPQHSTATPCQGERQTPVKGAVLQEAPAARPWSPGRLHL